MDAGNSGSTEHQTAARFAQLLAENGRMRQFIAELVPALADIHADLSPVPTDGLDSLNLAGLTWAEVEKKLILDTLAQTHGNREKAARILGIGERTIYRCLEVYGLVRKRHTKECDRRRDE